MQVKEAIATIHVSSLKRDEVNVIEVNDALTLIAFYDGDEIRVIRDVCPHTGGPLSKGHFCRESGTLTCPLARLQVLHVEPLLERKPERGDLD